MRMTTPPPADPNLPPQQPQYQQPPQYSQAPAPQPVGPLTVEQDINYSGWAFITASLGWAAFIGPLIIWLLYKERGPRVKNEGKEALNFGITVAIITVAANILFGILTAVSIPRYDFFTGYSGGFAAWWIFPLLQWLIIVGVFVIALVWGFKGRSVVAAGGSYRYPIAFRFIK
jgi:uncharacterized Tic20 family protein